MWHRVTPCGTVWLPVPPQHLLTMPLEGELRSAGDCLGRLRELEEQGRVWGQDVILEVKDQELVLSDVESKVTPEQGTPKARYLPARVPPKPGTLQPWNPSAK